MIIKIKDCESIENVRLIYLVEQCQKELIDNNVTFPIRILDEIISLLDNRCSSINQSQFNAIKNCLLSIRTHVKIDNSEFIMNKCNQIRACILYPLTTNAILSLDNDNENTLYELLNSINALEKTIKEKKDLQKEIVCENKAKWFMLESEIKVATQQMHIYSSRYLALLKTQNNKILANIIEEERAYAEKILNQHYVVDVEAVSDNLDYICEVNKEVDDTNGLLSEKMEDAFNVESLDEEYNRALSSKLAENSKDNATQESDTTKF